MAHDIILSPEFFFIFHHDSSLSFLMNTKNGNREVVTAITKELEQLIIQLILLAENNKHETSRFGATEIDKNNLVTFKIKNGNFPSRLYL